MEDILAFFQCFGSQKYSCYDANLLNVMWQPDGVGGVWGTMDTCVCMAEFFPCSPETITTLLTSDLLLCLVAKSVRLFGDLMDSTLPGSSVYGISQARILNQLYPNTK